MVKSWRWWHADRYALGQIVAWHPFAGKLTSCKVLCVTDLMTPDVLGLSNLVVLYGVVKW